MASATPDLRLPSQLTLVPNLYGLVTVNIVGAGSGLDKYNDAGMRCKPANGWSALGLNIVGCVTAPCIGNVVMPAAVGDSTVGVAAAAAAWNVPSDMHNAHQHTHHQRRRCTNDEITNYRLHSAATHDLRIECLVETQEERPY